MTDRDKQDDAAALVHWTYSREEWNAFMNWKKKRKGLIYYLVHKIFQKRNPKSPTIRITESQVSINNKHQPFHDASRRLQRINIRDAGQLNVVEISYQQSQLPGTAAKEIHVPVPKGRLKEAIDMEEKLNDIRIANPRD